MARGKVLDMKGEVVKTIPEKERQYWGNKDRVREGYIHIEEWFDDWLDESDDYRRQTYQELLKFESEFYYLKEFVCQIWKGVWLSVLFDFEKDEPIGEIFKGIEYLAPSAKSPFEELLIKWIVADYLHQHKDRKDIAKYEVDVCDFYNKVKAIVLKETEQYPI